ncbi:hypothetical protein [Paenibacillus sp. CCS19]|uniref:hypothetical protein n=1 Tax=Paenibacillus sp. CCS19 TaxID=3158387 RepID=UPI00295E90B3|nr:hypothetical protein [Paenibacillus cellulosilyticus]
MAAATDHSECSIMLPILPIAVVPRLIWRSLASLQNNTTPTPENGHHLATFNHAIAL